MRLPAKGESFGKFHLSEVLGPRWTGPHDR